MMTNGGRCCQIPLTGIMLFKCLVCKYARRAYFCEVSAELVFQRAILVPSKIDMILGCKRFEIVTSGIVAVKTYATVALYAAIHLTVQEGTKILIFVCALVIFEPPVCVT